MIRKGAITTLQECTVVGHLITMISEDKEICIPVNKKGESEAEEGGVSEKSVEKKSRTGIWLKGRFHPANGEGKVIIPYSENPSFNEKIILVHDNFADLSTLSIYSEEYELKCAYLYTDESFLLGNVAKILIQPRLYVNMVATSLKVLQNTVVNVVVSNYEQIAQNFRFTDLEFTHKGELVVEIPIKSQISSIYITVTASVEKNDKKKQQLFSDHRIFFNLYEGADYFTNLYLQASDDEGYSLFVLGKNGEPKVGRNLTVRVYTQLVNDKFTFNLQSD